MHITQITKLLSQTYGWPVELIAQMLQECADLETGMERPAGSAYLCESRLLYALVRLVKPEHVVEVGVCAGATTNYLAAACKQNGSGHVYAVDIAPGAGHLIRPELQEYITQITADIRHWEPDFPVDFVFEDSAHTYEITRAVWAQLRPHMPEGAWAVCHDFLHPPTAMDVRMGYVEELGTPDLVCLEPPSDCGLAMKRVYKDSPARRGGVVIPAYKQADMLENLVRTIRREGDWPIIVIDNSPDQSLAPTLDILRSDCGIRDFSARWNLGVAASWNLGIAELAKLGCERFLISNVDIELEPGAASYMLNQEHTAVFGMPFCFYTVTKRALDYVGYFDEAFWPAYYEDTDWLLRALRLALPIKYAECGATHKVATTMNIMSPDTLYDIHHRDTPFIWAYWAAKWGSTAVYDAATRQELVYPERMQTYAMPFGGRQDMRDMWVTLARRHIMYADRGQSGGPDNWRLYDNWLHEHVPYSYPHMGQGYPVPNAVTPYGSWLPDPS